MRLPFFSAYLKNNNETVKKLYAANKNTILKKV